MKYVRKCSKVWRIQNIVLTDRKLTSSKWFEEPQKHFLMSNLFACFAELTYFGIRKLKLMTNTILCLEQATCQ